MLSLILDRVLRDVQRKVTNEVSEKATDAVSGLFNRKRKSKEKEVTKKSDGSDLLTACLYVAFAASYADGTLDKSEEEEIEKVKDKLATEGNGDLAIKMMQIKGEKPSFGTAMKYVDKIEKDKLPVFDGIIDDILKADGSVDEQEEAFIKEWNTYKSGR
jgi:uncharacterized membrane protein YebE (DUF533 family)